MGPLSKVWYILEEAFQKNSLESLNTEELLEYIDSTVLLTGQVYNSVSYRRRLNILSAVGKDKHKAKTSLKDHAKLLEEPGDDLFGESFRKHVSDTAKAKKKSREIYEDKRKQRDFRRDNNKRPFPGAPSFRRTQNGGQSYGNSSTSTSSTNRRFNWQGGQNQGGKNFRHPNRNPRQGGNIGKSFQNRKDGTLHQHGTQILPRACSTRSTKVCTPSSAELISKSKDWKFSSCRKVKVFSAPMGKNNQQPRNIELGCRFEDRFIRRTFPKKNSPPGTNVQGGEEISRFRSGSHVGERCHPRNAGSGRPILKQHLPCAQENRGQQASDKFKTSECLHSISTFQNGGFALIKRSVERERLSVQDRSERRLLLCSSSQKPEKIYSVSLGGAAIRIFMPMLWPGTGPTNFHEIVENPYSYIEENKYKAHYLSGRHTVDGPVRFRIENGQRHTNLSLSTPGISNKSEEICSDTMSKDRVFGAGGGLTGNDLNTSKGEGDPSEREMQELDFSSTNHIRRNGQSDWLHLLDGSSRPTSLSSNAIPSTSVYSDVEEESRHSILLFPQRELHSGVEMVDEQPRTLQWEIPSKHFVESCDTDRRVEKGLGCFLSESENRGKVDSPGEWETHKRVGVESNSSSLVNFCKDIRVEECPLSNRQYDSPSLFNKNGGNKEPRNDCSVKGNLGNSAIQRDHDYSGVSPGGVKLCSGQGVKELSRLQRVAACQMDFPIGLSETRNPSSRPICIKGLSPTLPLCGLETGSNESSDRRLSVELEEPRPNICVSTVLFDREDSHKSKVRKGNSNFGDPTLASSIVVQPGFGALRSRPNISKTKTRSTNESPGTSASFGGKSNLESSGMENFRKGLLTEGLSTRASDLIIKARREGTRASYESAWGKWVRWCGERQADPHECGLNLVLDYLANLFEKSYEYSTINCHRSAISAYHKKIDNYDVGKHPKVCALLSGVFNERPPKPKYVFVWDVDQVLSYLESLATNNDLSDQLLNLKLAALLFLTSSGRCHEICYLDVRYKVKTSSSYKFYFTKVTKSWRRGQPPPVLEFEEFSANKKMCVVTCLSHYLERTAEWRTEGQNQLLLSHLSPHKEVKSSTISNWVKQVLKLSGIDVSKYQAHSCRSASTSKAKVLGLSVKEILERGRWSSKSTWQRFYNKEIETQPQPDIIFRGKFKALNQG